MCSSFHLTFYLFIYLSAHICPSIHSDQEYVTLRRKRMLASINLFLCIYLSLYNYPHKQEYVNLLGKCILTSINLLPCMFMYPSVCPQPRVHKLVGGTHAFSHTFIHPPISFHQSIFMYSLLYPQAKVYVYQFARGIHANIHPSIYFYPFIHPQTRVC